ncbi:ribose-phosphate diphosphokinase [Halobacterium litoreum]|uniref:Ribose-phosphate pyrophosphokinase n=1 Tax=Halobacterium litoreum TaxID=2039234 RepID=A0ABD5NEN3_9EURY|nr:ribose-phosphate diphosphokinase [Halobacterium litoreum]UHH13461.1 ribose-phosphate diphosphokinase [Halobacterium litoreum]
MILSGSATQSLAASLAADLGVDLGRVDYESFPDGEQMVTVPEVAGRAVVVASTVSSDAHVELLQLQDAAREAGASEVVTVLPYMGYARQDEAFETGQPVSARAVARAVSTGADRVVTVNPHEDAVLDFFDVPAVGVDAAPRLADPLPDGLADPVFLAPDDGAIGIAESVRDAYGEGDTDHFEKVRHSGSDVTVTPSDIDVSGRDVVVTDDIIATGSTMSEAIAALDDPARVFVTCVHPLLAGNARLKLANAGAEAVYGTDTLERVVSEVSAAPAIAEEL